MRKILVLILIVFTMSACTVVNINTNNYIDNINNVITRKSKCGNESSR